MNFFSFLSIHHAHSRAVNGHQMYFESLILGKAWTIGIDILPTPPLIFTEGQKVRNWRRLKHHSNLSRTRLKMQHDIRILKQKVQCCDDRPCPGHVW